MTKMEDAVLTIVNEYNEMLDALGWEDEKKLWEFIKKKAIERNNSLWISAEKRLPDYDEEVLVAYGNNDDICFNHRSKNDNVYVDKDGWCIVGYGGCVTHWMPIPELPKEEE